MKILWTVTTLGGMLLAAALGFNLLEVDMRHNSLTTSTILFCVGWLLVILGCGGAITKGIWKP